MRPCYHRTMLKRYSYRAYPAVGQQGALTRLFGCCRVVYNDALRRMEDAHKAGSLLTFGEASALMTKDKTTPERVWLTTVSAVPLQQSLDDLARAYRNFFRGKGTAGSSTSKPSFTPREDDKA